MMVHGLNGVKQKITNNKMKFFTAGNVSIIIALSMIAYALISYFVH